MLINFVLNSILSHTISITLMSNSIRDGVMKSIRNFLWGKKTGLCGLHLIVWDKVILPKDDGGLDIKDLNIMKSALQGRRIL